MLTFYTQDQNYAETQQVSIQAKMQLAGVSPVGRRRLCRCRQAQLPLPNELERAFFWTQCLLQGTCALCRPDDPANEWLCTLVYIGAGVCFASAFFLALMLVSWQCWQCSFCGRCYGIMPMTGACDGPA